MRPQALVRRRRPWGVHPKKSNISPQPKKLPAYLEVNEVGALIRAEGNPSANLLKLEQWKVGLRMSEVLAVAALTLDSRSAIRPQRVNRGQ